MTAPQDLREELQQELGREITVEREIARGHYFAVFEGRQKNGRRIVVKVVPPQLAAENPTRAGRVLRAARLAATIEHPHVVPVLRVAAGDRLAWFVTAFEPGSLQGLLEQECELPYERATQLLTQVAGALAAAHQRRVMHGDLTPAAVMLDDSGAARVRDFGIAPAAELRQQRTPVASYDPHYLAPERIEGGSPTAASDQYALGVIAYQMLAGTRPFFGATADMIRRQQLQQPVPDLRATRGDVPASVAAAVERALAKRPEERFPSVAAFATALRGETAPPQGRIPLIRDRQARAAGPAPRPTQGGLPPMPALEQRDLVRPRVNPGARPRGGRGGLQPAAAFVVVALGLAALWLYVASTGPSDATIPDVRVNAAEAPVTERSFGAITPPEPAPEEEITASGADSSPPEAAAKAPARTTQPARRPDRTAAAARERRPAPARETAAKPVAPPAPRSEDATTGFLTVGSVPQGAIFINGRLMPSNPVVAAPIAAGPVRLRFEAADANGRILEREMTINLGPGDSLNLGRVRLDRP